MLIAAVIGDHVIPPVLFGDLTRNIVRRNRDIVSGRTDGNGPFIAHDVVPAAKHQKAILNRAVPGLPVGINGNRAVFAVRPVVLFESIEIAELKPPIVHEGKGIFARVVTSFVSQSRQCSVRDIPVRIAAFHGVEAPFADQGRNNGLLFRHDRLNLLFNLIGILLQQRRKTGR